MDLLAHGLPPVPFGGQFDGHVARALEDRRCTSEGAWPVALDGRPLVHVGAVDLELVRAQLVGRLRVGDRGVEQLENVCGDGARTVLEDRLSVLDALAADVVHDEPGLARGAAHIPRARPHDQIALRASSALTLLRARGGLGGAAPTALLGLLFSGLLVGIGGSGGILAGLLGLLRIRLRRLDARDLLGVLRGALLLGRRRRVAHRLPGVVVEQALDQLGLRAALRETAGLELDLQLVDLQRLPAALRRRMDPVGHYRILTLSLPAWPRNIRVGANSPSLCPTIDSETNTGTCLRPSWTAIVWPTISGKIVDARDHVRIIWRELEAFMDSMRDMRRSSTHGPFLEERLISGHPSCRGDGRGRCNGRTACPSCGSGSRSSAQPRASAHDC